MKCALQLGRSNALMAYTVEANTVLNSMSEKLYSAEKEVPIIIILYFSITKEIWNMKIWNMLLYNIFTWIFELLVSVLYRRDKKIRRQIY